MTEDTTSTDLGKQIRRWFRRSRVFFYNLECRCARSHTLRENLVKSEEVWTMKDLLIVLATGMHGSRYSRIHNTHRKTRRWRMLLRRGLVRRVWDQVAGVLVAYIEIVFSTTLSDKKTLGVKACLKFQGQHWAFMNSSIKVTRQRTLALKLVCRRSLYCCVRRPWWKSKWRNEL